MHKQGKKQKKSFKILFHSQFIVH